MNVRYGSEAEAQLTCFLYLSQLHLIKHTRLLNHPAQYQIIQIIRRYVLGIQAHILFECFFNQFPITSLSH